MTKAALDLEAIQLLSRYTEHLQQHAEHEGSAGTDFFSLKRLAVSIGRNKVSSHLVIPSCGGRGVPGSAFYVAWLAEELIHGNKIILL